ncbi:unnamed protein product, partial [marine sediment metagenome]
GFAQVLTDPDATLQAGWTYTLTVEVGNSLDYPWHGYKVQLLAGGTPHTPGSGGDYTGPVTGGTLLAEDNNSLTIAVDTFETSTVTYTYNPEHASLLGEPLQIRLLTLGNVLAGDEYTEADFDNVKLDAAEPAPIARNPDPEDGATDVCRKVVLSWTPGMYADKHDVYFGTDFNDVNDANNLDPIGPGEIYRAHQDADSYPVPETLDFGQTYYWRIDEVNAPPDEDTIFKGDTWQFTVEPIAYPIAGDKITPSASGSYAADQGPENTINGSGLDANDMHSTVHTTDMWLSRDEEPGQAWIEYEFDKVYKLHEMWVWNHNSTSEEDLGFGFKDVTIEYSENGTDYTTLGGTTHEFAQAPSKAGYEHNTEVPFGVPAKYVRLTANSNWGTYGKYGLSEVRFYYIPVLARDESPKSGTTIDGVDVVLSWRPGREAAEHYVYFSTSFEDVNTGTIDPDIIDAGGECETSYGPLSLDLGKTYYWKG